MRTIQRLLLHQWRDCVGKDRTTSWLSGHSVISVINQLCKDDFLGLCLAGVSTKSAGLLPLSRLRTVRESFPSYGSSISSRCCATAPEMFLTVLVYVNHIVHRIRAPLRAGDSEVNLSFFGQVNGSVTHRANTPLLSPYRLEFTGQPSHSALKFSLFEVLRLQIWIGICPYFYMSDDWRVLRCFQFYALRTENPAPRFLRVPVFSYLPPLGLVGMPPVCPSP